MVLTLGCKFGSHGKLWEIMVLGPHPRLIESEWVDEALVWFKSSLDGSSVRWGLKPMTPLHPAALNWLLFCFFHTQLPAPPSTLYLAPSVPWFPFMFSSLRFILLWSFPFVYIPMSSICWNDSVIPVVFIERLLYTWYWSRKGRQQHEAGKDKFLLSWN